MSDFVGARAVMVLLVCTLAWWIARGLAAGLEFQLVRMDADSLPSFSVRAGLMLFSSLAGFIALFFAVHFASARASRPTGRPTGLSLLLLLLFTLVAIGGIAASVWFPKKTVDAIASASSVSRLAEWAEQSVTLAIATTALEAAGLLGAFLYSVWRWWRLARDCPAP